MMDAMRCISVDGRYVGATRLLILHRDSLHVNGAVEVEHGKGRPRRSPVRRPSRKITLSVNLMAARAHVKC